MKSVVAIRILQALINYSTEQIFSEENYNSNSNWFMLLLRLRFR